MLQPQQPNMLPSAQAVSAVVNPHISEMGNIQSSSLVSSFTDLSTSNPMQMHGAPRVTMQGSGHVADPRGQSSATAGVLLSQHPSMVSSMPAGLPQGGMNVVTTRPFQ